MTTVRYSIAGPDGAVLVRDCPQPAVAGHSAEYIAMEEIRGCPPGTTIRLWYDVPFGGSLDDLGAPTVVLTAE